MPDEHGKGSSPSFEYDWITDQVAIGTNACCQLHFDERLLRRGVTVDISLEGENIDRPAGIDVHLWLPTPDKTAPDLAKTLIGIAALERALAQGRKVFLHCRNGHGRAPTFFAAYLILEEGMRTEAAIGLIRRKRPSIHLEDVQRAFLEDL